MRTGLSGSTPYQLRCHEGPSDRLGRLRHRGLWKVHTNSRSTWCQSTNRRPTDTVDRLRTNDKTTEQRVRTICFTTATNVQKGIWVGPKQDYEGLPVRVLWQTRTNNEQRHQYCAKSRRNQRMLRLLWWLHIDMVKLPIGVPISSQWSKYSN